LEKAVAKTGRAPFYAKNDAKWGAAKPLMRMESRAGIEPQAAWNRKWDVE
jgi:hypothetical protein